MNISIAFWTNEGVHNMFATASRIKFIYMNYGRQWVQIFFLLFFALLLFCFHTSAWPPFH